MNALRSLLPTVQIVAGLEQAAALLDPTRLRLIRALAEPDSASGLARKLGIPRQRINYHLRELERWGLVRLVEQRRRRNCTERILQATARSYLVSPELLAELGPDPSAVRDRFSWAYLVALATRAIGELAALRRAADAAQQKLPTLALETELAFESPAALAAFADVVAGAIAQEAARQSPRTENARTFRVIVGMYPAITKPELRATSAPSGTTRECP